MNDSKSKKDDSKKNRAIKWLLLFLLLLLLGFGIWYLFLKSSKNSEESTDSDLVRKNRLDSIWIADSLAKTKKIDSLENIVRLESLRNDSIKKVADSLSSYKNQITEKTAGENNNTLNKITDSLPQTPSKIPEGELLLDLPEEVESEKIDPCAKDTVVPWVYPDPTGGLYQKKQSVKLICDDPTATVEWKIDDETEWRKYTGRVISVEKNLTICYRAVDSCDNLLEEKCKSYEIKKSVDAEKCPDDMTFIKVGSNNFCIDKYEWPNKKRKIPAANVSLYQAQDSCFAVGKRLCKTSEWSLACAGAYSWKYAYGVKYEKQACVTRKKSVQKSGSKAECRGYFEVFDMSGNLAEWTDTRSKKNQDFYNVMGGFWQSGSQSTCYKPRYSYYPQNSHNPVGFRCCKDSE